MWFSAKDLSSECRHSVSNSECFEDSSGWRASRPAIEGRPEAEVTDSSSESSGWVARVDSEVVEPFLDVEEREDDEELRRRLASE